ncbi:ESX secretion-associated protein EspG [Nocardia sp. AG03]|uniref:ESX secretion-associated protein EspG n=1 Tax=Nocardia sp. AG03 TaxID=3025312 RepID=UPI00241867F9|nr:ESX secretion-associated protein EspG [Nocardia sp. AG03]
MTGSTWQMEGLTFTIALEALGRDRLPYPLSWFPRDLEFPGDLERSRATAAQRLASRFDEALYSALAVLLEPEMRIEVYGFYGPDQSQVVRIHAGISGHTATLAVQRPGPTREYGTDITVSTHQSHRIAAEVIGRLPRLSAGGHRPFHGRRSEMEQPTYGRHPTRLSPVEEMQRFFRRERIGMGEITVLPGFALDSKPTDDGRAFLWLDYPNDGRYLLHELSADDISITPGPPDELLRQLQERVDATARTLRPAPRDNYYDDEDDPEAEYFQRKSWLV